MDGKVEEVVRKVIEEDMERGVNWVKIF